MSNVIMIGCDLHDNSMLLKIAVGRGKPWLRAFDNDADARRQMIAYLKSQAATHRASRIVFAYEASGQGFGLHDQLTEAGIECHVLAPSEMAVTPGQRRRKTDERDAQKILDLLRAHVLAGVELPAVWIPDPATRDDREVVRTRLDVVEKLTAVRTQMQSLLKRHHLRRQLAAYLGLVPSCHETGTANDRKGHITRQGPARIRKLLCQASWVRVRCDRREGDWYQSLKARNPKKTKIAIVAAMRRLGILMWHRAREAMDSPSATKPSREPAFASSG